MSRRCSRLALVAGAAAVALATLALRQAGRGSLAPPPLSRPREWGGWVAGRDPVTAAVALLRLLALAGVWYLGVVSVVGLGLRLVRAQGLVSVADRVTLPGVRRLLAAAAGLTLASGVSPALAFAHPSPVPAAVASPAHPLAAAPAPSTTLPPSTTTTTLPGRDPPPTLTMRLLPAVGAPHPAPEPAVVAPATADAGAVESSWTVRPGECFWSIADDVLTTTWGRPPTDAEIVPYWRTLIEANRALLADRSNPDLIFPGQVFTTPPVPSRPPS